MELKEFAQFMSTEYLRVKKKSAGIYFALFIGGGVYGAVCFAAGVNFGG